MAKSFSVKSSLVLVTSTSPLSLGGDLEELFMHVDKQVYREEQLIKAGYGNVHQKA
jgi:hypothetical protein